MQQDENDPLLAGVGNRQGHRGAQELYAEAATLKIRPEFKRKAKKQKDDEITKKRQQLQYSNVPVQFAKGTSLSGVVGKSVLQNQTLIVNLKDGITISSNLTTTSGRSVAKSLVTSLNPWIVSGVALAVDFAIAYHQWRKHRIKARLLREMVQAVARHGTCLAGATLGALLGTMIFPGIGTIIGGVLLGILAPLAVSKAIILIEKIPNKAWSNDQHYRTSPPLIVYHESLDFLDIPRSDKPPRYMIEQKRSLKIMDTHPELTSELPSAKRSEKLKMFLKTLQAYEMIKEYLLTQGEWDQNYGSPAPSPPLTPPPRRRQPQTPPISPPPSNPPHGQQSTVPAPVANTQHPPQTDLKQESLTRASISSNGGDNSTLSQRGRSPSEINPLEGKSILDSIRDRKDHNKPRGQSVSSNASISFTAAEETYDDVLKELKGMQKDVKYPIRETDESRTDSSDDRVIIHTKFNQDVVSPKCKLQDELHPYDPSLTHHS